MKFKKRRYSYTYDDYTIFFDIGDCIITKYGNYDVIVDIIERENALPMVYFANISPLDTSRISDRVTKKDVLDYINKELLDNGIKPKSKVKFIQHNDIYLNGFILETFIKDFKPFCKVDSDSTVYTVSVDDLEVIEHYRTNRENIEYLIREHTNFQDQIYNKETFIDALLEMVENRKNKIDRLIDDMGENS